MELRLGEIARATGGRLLRGDSGERACGVSTDTRRLVAGESFFALRGERFDGHRFVGDAAAKGAACAVGEEAVASGLDKTAGACPLIAVPDTTKALADLASHVRASSTIPWVAITGSAGKTTTKELTSAALGALGPVLKAPASYNNRIGVPLTVLALEMDHRAAVTEIGTSAPGEVAPLAAIVRPTVAVLTTIGPAHVESFGSLAAIAREKAELFGSLKGAPEPGGVAVLPSDCPEIGVFREAARGRIVSFGFGEDSDVRAEDIATADDGASRFRVGPVEVHLRLAGRANVANALAALAVAEALGIEREGAARRVSEVSPPPMRGRLREARGIRVYEDCYNANPLSFAAALESWRAIPSSGRVASGSSGKAARRGRRWVVAGDMRELGDGSAALHEELGEAIARAGAEALLAVGEFASHTARGAAKAGLPNWSIVISNTADDAAPRARDIVREGDLVLVKGSRAVGLERVVEALMDRDRGT